VAINSFWGATCPLVTLATDTLAGGLSLDFCWPHKYEGKKEEYTSNTTKIIPQGCDLPAMLFLQGLCMFLNICIRFQVLGSGFKGCNRWILFPICNDLNYIPSLRVLVSKLLTLRFHIPEVRIINPEL
jgi:hypothetical protein